MAGRVEQHTNVLSWLVLGNRRSEGDGGFEVADLEVEVHHGPLGALSWRPYGSLVIHRRLEHDEDGTVGRRQYRRSWLLVADGPAQQLRIEARQRVRVRRFDRGSPPHGGRSGSHPRESVMHAAEDAECRLIARVANNPLGRVRRGDPPVSQELSESGGS